MRERERDSNSSVADCCARGSSLPLVVPLTHVAATASVEGKMSKGLRKLLKKVYSEDLQDQLAVADAKLGSAIKVHPLRKCFEIGCIGNAVE